MTCRRWGRKRGARRIAMRDARGMIHRGARYHAVSGVMKGPPTPLPLPTRGVEIRTRFAAVNRDIPADDEARPRAPHGEAESLRSTSRRVASENVPRPFSPSTRRQQLNTVPGIPFFLSPELRVVRSPECATYSLWTLFTSGMIIYLEDRGLMKTTRPEQEYVNAVGRSIRDRRKARGLSQEELAASSGLHRTYIGAVERGERNPTVISLTRIAEALRTSPARLLAASERAVIRDRRKRTP